jgi:hypothetical protein
MNDDNQTGIILCGVCKNVISTLPVIRAAFEYLVAKAGVQGRVLRKQF